MYSQTLVTISGLINTWPTVQMQPQVPMWHLLCLLLLIFETRSCVVQASLRFFYVAKDNFELLIFQIPSLYLLNAGITGVHQNTRFMQCWGSNPGLNGGWTSTPPTELQPHPSIPFSNTARFLGGKIEKEHLKKTKFLTRNILDPWWLLFPPTHPRDISHSTAGVWLWIL